MRTSWSLTIVGVVALGIAPAHAQTPPPIHGVTGTIATEGTIKSEQKAAHKGRRGDRGRRRARL